MKKIFVGLVITIAVAGVSCSKQLDINNNPNQATSATAELILPQALTNTASALNGYNSYGAQTVGYSANAGGYGGFGAFITYNFTTEYSNLWTATYDNLADYQAILNKTTEQVPLYVNFSAAARIMKAYDFQLLVDAYNDIPYSQALKGADNLTPAYDQGAAIYAELAKELDTAIALIHTGMDATETVNGLGSSDVLFEGDMEKWLQLANTIKLRLIIRGGDKVSFANTSFDEAGFLTEDALINPGYTRDNAKQNPAWNTWGWAYTGVTGSKSWMPNTYVMGFYNGTKLKDPVRGSLVYYQYPTTPTNRLGTENNDIAKSPDGSFWFRGEDRDGGSNGDETGVLKGPDAGYPVMLAAESYFLQAEGVEKGIITGDAKALFDAGITASFNYLSMYPDKSVEGSPATEAAAYIAANAGSYLVNYTLANTPAKKLEAIITQKYIALNFINSHEAWNEYRRTHFPAIKPTGDGSETFASAVSESPRADKLPTRILYPSSEGSYNGKNVPTGITPTASTIFWAQ